VTALMTDTGPGKLTTLPFYFSRKNTQKLDWRSFEVACIWYAWLPTAHQLARTFLIFGGWADGIILVMWCPSPSQTLCLKHWSLFVIWPMMELD
jgi:hypothetical protein